MKHTLEHAGAIALDLCQRLAPFADELLVAGSIRRQRPQVKDIDLVMIPADRSGLGIKLFELCGQKLKVTGQIVRFNYRGMPVDLYLVDPEQFPIVALVRTGSADHNAWLARRALRMGKRLNFARGVEVGSGTLAASGFHFWIEKRDLRAAEGEIFKALGLPNIPPELRELDAPHVRAPEIAPLGSARGESSPGGSDS